MPFYAGSSFFFSPRSSGSSRMTINPISMKISLGSPLKAIGETLYTISPSSSNPLTSLKRIPPYYQGTINTLSHCTVFLHLCLPVLVLSSHGISFQTWGIIISTSLYMVQTVHYLVIWPFLMIFFSSSNPLLHNFLTTPTGTKPGLHLILWVVTLAKCKITQQTTCKHSPHVQRSQHGPMASHSIPILAACQLCQQTCGYRTAQIAPECVQISPYAISYYSSPEGLILSSRAFWSCLEAYFLHPDLTTLSTKSLIFSKIFCQWPQSRASTCGGFPAQITSHATCQLAQQNNYVHIIRRDYPETLYVLVSLKTYFS